MKVCSVCGQIDFTGTLFWCPLCDYAMVSLEPINELMADFSSQYDEAIRAAKYLEIHAAFFRPQVCFPDCEVPCKRTDCLIPRKEVIL